MKTILVCPHCGSAEIYRDACVAVNDPDNVNTYDSKTCNDCGYESDWNFDDVEVPDDFDVYTDRYGDATSEETDLLAFLIETHADQGGEASFDDWLNATWHEDEYGFEERARYLQLREAREGARA